MKKIIKELGKKINLKGEITIEASIVVPIIMLIIAFIIAVAFYVHDITATSAYSYGKMIEINNEENTNSVGELAQMAASNAPVFMADNAVSKANNDDFTIEMKNRFPIKWVNNIVSGIRDINIEAEIKMNTEMLYICKSVVDTIK